MEYVAPASNPGPGDTYRDRDASIGQAGSKVPAAAIQHPMEEIVNVITAGGLVPDGEDRAQLLAALQGPALLKPPIVNVYTASDTWTKPAGLKAVMVELVGGGGSSGGSAATTASQAAASGGGGAGGYARKIILAADLGATETVTVGAPGAAGAAAGDGNPGGTSSFGAHCSATGGLGSGAGLANGNDIPSDPGGATGGVGTGGDLNVPGGAGKTGLRFGVFGHALGGAGGDSVLGAGGVDQGVGVGQAQDGNPGRAFGGGASGSANGSSMPAIAGSAGAAGVVIVTEIY